MQLIETLKYANRKLSSSVTFKIVMISIIMLTLLIPAAMVKSLIRERESRKVEAVHEINGKWGRQQTVAGPVISVPYKETNDDYEGEAVSNIRYFHILPDELDIKSTISPEVRYRGIYESVLYNTRLEITGRFPVPDTDALQIPDENIIWSGAFLSMGISDMIGIKDRITTTFDGQEVDMEPGIPTGDILQTGVSAGIELSELNNANVFQMAVNLNGSRRIAFTPVGKVTTAKVSSPWKDPSFTGAFLPADRQVTDKGFSARWKVLHLNRNYPQIWKGRQYKIADTTFGVQLFTPVDIYQQSMRTAKYALMFIVFTFMAFFLSEVMNRLKVHPVQYMLIGLAIIIFYTLLISISEYLNFAWAYLISAGSVIGLTTGYARSILTSNRAALMVGGIMTALYTYLYILLQIESFALLMGSVGLFMVLGVLMYVTRKINWYGISAKSVTE